MKKVYLFLIISLLFISSVYALATNVELDKTSLNAGDTLKVNITPGSDGYLDKVYFYDKLKNLKSTYNLKCGKNGICKDSKSFSYKIPEDWRKSYDANYYVYVYDYSLHDYIKKEFVVSVFSGDTFGPLTSVNNYSNYTCVDQDADTYSGYNSNLCPVGNDCNDDNRNIYPNANESCDGLDNDCDTAIDEGCDKDIDGYCDWYMRCTLGNYNCGDANVCTDCDDTNVLVYKGATELCDGLDNNCNFRVDEDCTTFNYTHTFPKGWSIISLPGRPLSSEPGYVFQDHNFYAGPLHKYNINTGGYDSYPYVDFDINVSEGYWLYCYKDEGCEANFTGKVGYHNQGTILTHDSVPIRANKWNMIGVPSDKIISFENLSIRRYPYSGTLNYKEAARGGWIQDEMTGYENGVYFTAGSGMIVQKHYLEPWKGYWLYSYVDGELVLGS